MKEIFKYPLEIEYEQGLAKWNGLMEITMPQGAKILSVGLQGEKAVMWALVHPHALPAKRSVAIVATGDDVPSWLREKFIGTLIFGVRGDIVLHVFG